MSLPSAIQRNPDLDRWVHVSQQGFITVRTGKVEIGQGVKTAIAMIAAEEFDVSVERIRVQTADTETTPDEGVTSGSMSVEDSGSAIRIACAAARQILISEAALSLGVAPASLTVTNGLITSTQSNEDTDYWLLHGGRRFEYEISEMPVVKDPHGYTTVGHAHTRVDLTAKIRGEAAFVHDITLPHMRHGRLVKPPTPEAELLECPASIDEPGVEIVRDGNFVGVVALHEERAIDAAQRLASLCEWKAAAITVAPQDIPAYLRNNVTHSLPVVDGTPVDEMPNVPCVPAQAATTLQASYYRPFQMHAAMGPSAAVAHYINGMLTVYSHSQGVELLKLALAEALALNTDQVHVIHAEGAGCYGHNGADDVSMDAALLAMAVEPHPVSVKWTRAEEHGFEPYGPAAVLDMQASLDGDGRVIDWRHESFGFSHIGRPRPTPGYTNLLPASWRQEHLPMAPRRPVKFPEVGIHRNLQPIYAFANKFLVKHFVPHSPLRTSSLRSLGAFANVFAIESFMDELALEAGIDAFEFRLRHLQDQRARRVLELLREQLPSKPDMSGCGRGIALARYKNKQTYCAIGVDVHVSDDAKVTLQHAVITADAGLVIDPDGLTNQLEGGFVQAASWALKEEVVWDAEGITSRDWQSYPILKFSEVPQIETYVLNRPGEKAMGAGEASTGPTPAAIANAVYSASAIRVREIPFTPERLRRAAAL